MAYDSKCLDLAQYFLGCEGDEGDDEQAALAQKIQDAIEGHLALSEENCALRTEASAAWDKCEERRLEAVRLADTLAAVKGDLLRNEPRQLGPILRKIDAALAS